MKIKIPFIERGKIRIPGVKSYVLVAIFVFIVSMLTTLLTWHTDMQRTNEQKKIRLSEQAESFEANSINRLQLYEQAVRGATGLFAANDQVSRTSWNQFINQLNLKKSYPGISGMGYVSYLKPDQVAAYTATQSQEIPGFKILPEGVRSEYAPITYTEPSSTTPSKALGFDILTNQERRTAAIQARDSGVVSLSDKLILTGDQTNASQPAFIMYTAVYKNRTPVDTVDQRRANLDGYIFAAYRAKDFFDQVVKKTNTDAYTEFQVFDTASVNADKLLYETANFKNADPDDTSPIYEVKAFDHTWTYRFAGSTNTNRNERQSSNIILFGGSAISIALAGFLFLVMFTRARAIVYTKQNEAQQAKDDLLSLASHQLRTPATAVKQYLGMILEGYTGEIDKQQLPALQKAYASNERQLDTINQILYVAKADAGRLSINPDYFDLNLLVDDITLELTDALEEKDQTVVIERSRKKLKVFADEASIRMVVENLISNASKYSFEDSQITVKTGIRDNYIYIAITDQGVGIAEVDREKLFKKFSRIDNELSLQVGGSGIGLYIDKVLIELHGGHIEVASELGKGSVFTIFLPKDNASNLTDDKDNDASV